jgi:hypothetical protein
MMLRPNPWKPDYVGAYTGPLDPIDALRNGAIITNEEKRGALL